MVWQSNLWEVGRPACSAACPRTVISNPMSSGCAPRSWAYTLRNVDIAPGREQPRGGEGVPGGQSVQAMSAMFGLHCRPPPKHSAAGGCTRQW